jgi:chromosome segregation ATPase
MSKNAELITDELVAAIADRMVEEGKRVSPVTIWSEARGGSLVAIVAALERWRDARQPRTPDLQVQAGLPEGLAETIMSAAGRIWTTSQDEAEKSFSQRLTAMSQRVDAGLAERDEALAEFQRLADEIEAGRERLSALTDALNTSESAATRLGAELATATGRADAAETRGEEFSQRVSVADANLEATQASLAEERRARDELATVVSGKNDEIARLTQERDDARQEAATLSDACQAKSEEAEKWSQEASAVTARAQAAEARVEELVQGAALADASLEATKAWLEDERTARDELAAVVASKNDEIARVTQDLEEARQQIASLGAAGQAKSEEVERLSREASATASRAQSAEARVEELLQRASTADTNLEATKTSLEEERREREALAAALSSKNDEIAQLTHERDDSRQQIATLSETSKAKSEEVEKWSQEASAANSRAQAAETQATESLTRLAALEAELDEAHRMLAAEHQTAAARLDEGSVQANELQRITRELEETRQQVGTLTEAKTAASAELAQLAQDASAAKERADTAERHAAQLAQRLAELADAAAAAEEDQRGQHPGVRADEPESVEEVAALQRQLSAQAKAHEKALYDLRTNAQQWVTHAKDLKQRLGQAGERMLFVDARSTGEVALVRRLASELERLKPDHELISREAQQKLIGTTMNLQLAQKGYRYDPATAVMSKIDS